MRKENRILKSRMGTGPTTLSCMVTRAFSGIAIPIVTVTPCFEVKAVYFVSHKHTYSSDPSTEIMLQNKVILCLTKCICQGSNHIYK